MKLTKEDKELLYQCALERRHLREKIKVEKQQVRKTQNQINALSSISLAKKFDVHPDYIRQIMREI